MTDLVGSGMTVFLTTQYLEEADRLADRIAVLDGGPRRRPRMSDNGPAGKWHGPAPMATATYRPLPAGLAGSGMTVFLTTQYLEEADRLADRVAVLDGGRIVAEGSPAQLKQRVAGHRLDLMLADAAAFEEVARLLGGRVARRDRERLTIGVATDGRAAQVRALLDEVDPARRAVDRFAVHGATLDDVFLALTGHPADRPDHEAENQKEPANV